MPKYVYLAKDYNGVNQTGMIEVGSLELFYQKLKERGLFCVTVHEEEGRQSREILGRNRMKPKELALFCRQLGTMLSAGLSVVKALDVIYQQTTSKKQKEVILFLYESVQRGDQLSVGMKRLKQVFPQLMIHMFEAGEKSGTVDQVCKRLAVHFEKEYRIRHMVTNSMIYPAVLFVITVLVLILMLAFVLPTFTRMYTQSGAELPLLTRIVMGASDFLVTKWYLVVAAAGAALVALKMLGTNEGYVLWRDNLRLRVPFAGKLYTTILAGRFARSLSSLISSGLPLLTALELVDRIVGNAKLSRSILTVRDDIRRGVSFSAALKKTESFPIMLVSMIGIGEESGALETVLQSVADIYDEETENAVKKMVSLLEPAMIVMIAGLVGTIVFAMVLPMFGMYALVG